MKEEPLPVIHDHDGNMDDLIALAMLAADRNVDLRATTLCPADCYPEPTGQAVEKLLTLLGRTNILFAAGDEKGINPFPHAFRKRTNDLPSLPILRDIHEIAVKRSGTETAPQLLARLLSGGELYDLIETGPLTNVADAIALDPEIVHNIHRLWVMGGALRVGGNVERPGHDGSAEWNFFNHPKAANEVFSRKVPITLVALDVTNTLPLTQRFLERLKKQAEFPLSRFAREAWGLVLHDRQNPYYLWDVLTVAAYLRPGLFRMEKARVRIIRDGPSQGRSVECSDGHEVDFAASIDREEAEQFFLDAFRA